MKLNLRRAHCARLAIALLAMPAAGIAEERVEVVPIPNARLYAETVLVGGQPTVENLQRAVAAGYRTVVDLRVPGELEEWNEREVALDLGLGYVSIPIAGPADLTPENAKRLHEALRRTDDRPTILHCGSSNRAGALLALRAFHHEGLDASAALELGRNYGLTSLASAVADALEGAD